MNGGHMTSREAIIARIAMRLGRDSRDVAATVADENKVMESFIRTYQSDRSCRWAFECLETGRCSFDPVCNN